MKRLDLPRKMILDQIKKRFFNSKRMAIDEEDDSGMELQEKETKVDVNDNSVISAWEEENDI